MRLLRALGVTEVRSAENGVEALALLDADPADVMICDLVMPGMDGVELLRHVGARELHPAVILMSGVERRVLQTAEQLAHVHRLNLLGTIEKPPSRERLAALIRVAEGDRPAVKGPARGFVRLTPTEIRNGLGNDCLRLHYQPKIDLGTGMPVGVEALARWQDPERGLLGPGAFVPVAEESGLIHNLTERVIELGIAQLGSWLPGGISLQLALNISVDDLDQYDFVDFIIGHCEASGVDPRHLLLEVTETRIMNEVTKPLEILARLRMRGIGLAIDDFGTGFSSLQQLQRIPFSELKIDRAFVANADSRDESRAVLESSLSLAKRLGLVAVGEGVETEAERALLRDLGCDFAQGFLIARPMPPEELIGWVADRC